MARFLPEGFDEKPLLEVTKTLEPRIKNLLFEKIENYLWTIFNEAFICESPIEFLMAIELLDLDETLQSWADDGKYNLNLQHEITILEKTYRVDFLIHAVYQGKEFKVVVECDGYDFHEKTKTQATRDKQRDRTLINAGYIILRFTGSEIWANPSKCAREALRIIFPHIPVY